MAGAGHDLRRGAGMSIATEVRLAKLEKLVAEQADLIKVLDAELRALRELLEKGKRRG
jgi:uncharacterized coiled-coil protein SlyX